jgi:hypothetical protein
VVALPPHNFKPSTVQNTSDVWIHINQPITQSILHMAFGALVHQENKELAWQDTMK